MAGSGAGGSVCNQGKCNQMQRISYDIVCDVRGCQQLSVVEGGGVRSVGREEMERNVECTF